MEFNKTEHIAKLYDIMKAEGTYLKYLRFIKRGAHKITQDIVEDIYNRHGQNLDGDLKAKFKETQVREELTNEKD
jgi:hypothetical protein